MRENQRTSDDYEPLVIFHPNGSERRASVYRHRDPLRATMTLDAARDGLGSGQMVWVSPADAPALRAWRAGA